MINGEANNQYNIYNASTQQQDDYKIMKDVDYFMKKKLKQIKFKELIMAKQVEFNNMQLQ